MVKRPARRSELKGGKAGIAVEIAMFEIAIEDGLDYDRPRRIDDCLIEVIRILNRGQA
jgi:hypothetical protein